MDGTRTMADVYAAFDDFSGVLSAKIDERDPSAKMTQRYIDDIQAICRSLSQNKSQRKTFSIESKRGHEICLVLALTILTMAMVFIVFRS